MICCFLIGGNMSKFTKEEVNNYADKLLIGLTEEENQMVLEEFDIIDADINLINQIEGIETTEPMSFCLDDFTYELDEDKIEESVDIEQLLQNCDDYRVCEIKVPKVVKNNEE